MNTRKKLILLILSFIFLTLSACKEVENPILLEQSLIFVIPSEGNSYDINLGNETYSLSIMSHLSETLVKIDRNGELKPGAASSWTVNADNTRFTFHLREDLKWSDGLDLTAEHFSDGFFRIIAPELKSSNASMITPYILNAKAYYEGQAEKDEVGIQVIDKKTLKLTLKVPTPFLLDLLSQQIFSPSRNDIIQKGGDGWDKKPEIAVSSGAYILSEYVKDDSTTLKKNKSYWNAENVKLDRLIFKIRGDTVDVVKAYNSGMVHGVYEVLSSDFRLVPDRENESFSRLMPSTAFLIMNHENKSLKDKEFREALSLSIDRELLVKNVLFGAGVPTEFLVPFLYKIGGEPYRDFTELNSVVDLEKSQKLLNDLNNKDFDTTKTIRFFHIESGVDAVASKEIIRQWEENLGIKVISKAMNWSDLYERTVSGDFDVVMMGWGGDYHHPMTFLSLFLKDSFYSSLIRWHDENYEKALNDSLLITDPKLYLQALRDIEGMILDEDHIIPIYHRKNLFLMSKELKGWYTRGSNFIFDEAYFE